MYQQGASNMGQWPAASALVRLSSPAHYTLEERMHNPKTYADKPRLGQ